MKAFITGVTSGIGKATAEMLSTKGWMVYGCSRHYKDVQIKKFFKLDVADYEHWKLVLDHVCYNSPLDLLVNNAGIFILDENNSPIEKLLEMVNTNLMGVYYGCRLAKKYVRPGGLVINIASVAGIKPEPENPLYTAIKAGVIHMTKSFAKGTDKIRFVSISPGIVKTNLVPGNIPPELLENVWEKRPADPKEIAQLIFNIFYTPYINGTNIVIDGGGSL